MGILKAVTGLFAGPVDANNIADAVIKSVDAMVLTEEEKIQYRQMAVEWKMKYMAATTGSRRARRVLAVAVMATFLFAFTAACLIFGIEYYWLGNPLPVTATDITGVAPVATPWADYITAQLAKQLQNPVNLVLVFYFTMDIAGSLRGKP